MKERYTITLGSTIRAGNLTTSYHVWEYDVTKLIPIKHRGKKILIESSFDTEGMGLTNFGSLEVVLEKTPQSYNVQNPPQGNTIVLGWAQPFEYWDTDEYNYKYSYNHSGCNPTMIDYPTMDSISVTIEPKTHGDTNDAEFTLQLAFTVLDD